MSHSPHLNHSQNKSFYSGYSSRKIDTFSPYLNHPINQDTALLTSSSRITATSLLEALDLNNKMTSEDFWEKVNLLNEEQYQILTILIFRRDPSLRSELEIDFIQKIMQNFTFFSDIKEKISRHSYRELLKELKFESHNKSDILFNYGDSGKKFYLILSGSVSVLVPKSKNKLLLDKNLNKFKVNVDKTNIKKLKNSMTEEEQLLEAFPNMQLINILKQGKLFGEISLSLKEPRTATVVCREECAFGTLKEHTYERILKNNYEMELRFLKNSSIFQGFSQQNLAILKEYIQEVSYSKDAVIYRQNEESNRIFIIKEGEVELAKIYKEEEVKKSVETMKIKHSKKQKFSIGKLGAGETFGEEEIFLEKPRLCMAIVSSLKAKIMYISKEKLFQNLKSLKSLNSIKNHFNMKFKWRSNQLKGLERLLHEKPTEEKEQIDRKRELLLQTFIESPSAKTKSILLETISLKHIKKEIKEKSAFGLYFSRKKPVEDLSRERKKLKMINKSVLNENENRLKKYEVSPILKMCAVSTALSKFEKRKTKFIMPNIKLMTLNFENEMKKSIANCVNKKNVNFSSGKKEYQNYLGEKRKKNQEVELSFEYNRDFEKKALIKNLGIEEYFLKEEWNKGNIRKNENRGFLSMRNNTKKINEDKCSFYCYPFQNN